MVGPTTQEDLFSFLTKFRTYNNVLAADIANMYRQTLQAEEDSKYYCETILPINE